MENETTLEALLTLREARELLGVSNMSLWRLRNNGELPVVRIGGRVLVEPQALRDLIAANSVVKRRDPAETPGPDAVDVGDGREPA